MHKWGPAPRLEISEQFIFIDCSTRPWYFWRKIKPNSWTGICSFLWSASAARGPEISERNTLSVYGYRDVLFFCLTVKSSFPTKNVNTPKTYHSIISLKSRGQSHYQFAKYSSPKQNPGLLGNCIPIVISYYCLIFFSCNKCTHHF